MLPITKPFLPPKEEYVGYLEGIWKRNWLTNNGLLLKELEKKLQSYLNIEYLSVVGNGTIALQMAIKLLNISGQVITTPFSYVATTAALVWENCQPVFVDITKDTFNIDPTKIEAAITSQTSAILATHVYGNPCNIEAIKQIAEKHKLKVIYDSAHCFGTQYRGKSIFAYGDVSTASFHTTKIFHMVEGGAVITKDADLQKKINYLRNFGHAGEEFQGLGINGKASEIHAAMGLCNLKYINDILEKRKQQWVYYYKHLNKINVEILKIQNQIVYNHAYFPIVFPSEEILLAVKKNLERKQIFTRRYFYPLLSTLSYVNTNKTMPVAEKIAKNVLCLPLYHELKEKEQKNIIDIIKLITEY